MEWTDLCSPAYRLNTPNAACSAMRNCYLETVEKGPRAGKLRIRGIPGMKLFGTLPDSPLRAMLAIDGGNRLFTVSGQTVFEVFADGTNSPFTGPVALNQHPAIMVTNGFQLAIASGGQLYLVEGAPLNTVTPVNFTDGTPVKAGTVDFLDNYFIANIVNTKQVVISNLAPDGGIWDPGDAAIKEGYGDNIARVLADNEQLWLFGFETTEVWQNTGALFPFERIQGAVLRVGTSAPYSPACARGYRFWLWNNVVYAAYGIDPQRISDFGVEEALQTYPTTQDAEGWCQIIGGHIFYFLHFPSVGRTWVYDLSIKAWHERGLWSNGAYSLYRGRMGPTPAGTRAFGKDLVGDPQNGNIYQLDENTNTDAGGVPLRREIIAPYITENMAMVRYNQLTVDADTGVGLDVAPDQPGYDPQMIMRYSDDRGKTWSNERQASMGRIGQTKTRIIYNQNGSSRIGKTLSLVVTDPVPLNINTGYLKFGQPDVGRQP